MNNVKVIVITLIVGVAWLQYNLGFYAAVSGIILLTVVIIFSLAINHQKAVSESILEHKKADTRIQLEHLRILRQSMQAESKLEARAAQMAMPLVRHSIGAVKAQLEAKYAAKYDRFMLSNSTQRDEDLPADPGEDEFDPYSADTEDGQIIDSTAW